MNNNKGWGKIIIRKAKKELGNGLRGKNLEADFLPALMGEVCHLIYQFWRMAWI